MTYSIFNFKKQDALSALFLLTSCIGFSQNDYKPAVESFETAQALNAYKATNGKISISDSHKKYGKSSLQWEWKGKSSIGTSNFKILTAEESPLEYGLFFPSSPTLQMAIYNEKSQNGKITISFEKNGAKQVEFDVPLAFTGWRTIWVPFYEMQGNAPKKLAAVDYDYFRITASEPTGKLFFDDIIYSQYQDDRHQYPDEIVPFIKSKQNLSEDHWMPLIVNYDRIKNLKPAPITDATEADLKKLEIIIDQNLGSDKKSKVNLKSLREDYKKLNLTDNGKTIVGPPLTFKEHQDYYDEKQLGPRTFTDVQDFGKTLKKIASSYNNGTPAEQEEMKTMFLNGTKYFLDQGWQAGSNGGTRHHIGYNVRQLTEAVFTMRQVLKDNNLLAEVGASLHWIFNIGNLLDDPNNFHVNIDYLNTQSYYHLMLIFLFENQEMQAAMVQAYSNYISITLAQQSEEWGFKVDGTAWHHNGSYPAYGLGAFQNVPKVIKTLSGTQFRIGTLGHQNFKHSFLTSRAYSQLYNWGFGNAGRHPLENNNMQSLKPQFLEMAYSGNPEGTSAIDTDVAAAYLRLWGKEDPKTTAIFAEKGIQPEVLSGYRSLPYGATGIYRRDDWAAIIKGYSKYVWASEIYVKANRYGRYPANGTIQLLNADGETASGFVQEGWDWNRYPGATVIHLPLKELEPKLPLIMFRSNESFAGSTVLGQDGIFGMILKESKGSNADGNESNLGFPGKLTAKKSVFSFGGKMIAIGTDIASIDEKNPTQTNIFQSSIKDTKSAIVTASETITKFPYDTELKINKKSGNWLIDPYGNGYNILSNTAVNFKKAKQQSYHNEYSINTGIIEDPVNGAKETYGDFASAWIDHGFAPKNASYQYVIYPFLSQEKQNNFGKIVKNDKSFEIKRADSVAHIVLNKETNTTCYVIFEANQSLDKEIVKEVSAPALIMVNQNKKNALTISAVQPDLNFPEYKPGKFRNYSRAVELKITLVGKWTTASQDYIKNIDNSGANTIITLECINGLPREFIMNKI
ncbi:chondroitin-sulfate-ABC endolyase/exolyase [Flavobacterium sp. PL11]|uniref:chondroitinase family polysaccharide lyase n=1 Tax=Flavobacterium sp. PL11 TaxID=3071717 RepID=UPI002E025A96|nr:chondroitin-sulfate-ABC endolyase/exolyase [Flavobacterium sp. PL11]